MGVFICQGCGAEHANWGGNCPNCGNTETIRLNASKDDPMVGKIIKNKYKIIKRLGQGGMGAVYLAEQMGIGLKVALKFLKAEFSADPEICKRFLNEAKSYALVAHPNAVTLHEFGQDEEGNLFLAMEYVDGTDLKKELAEVKRLSPGVAIDIILQAADILGHAHSRGVVHRDLKPENVMLRKGMRGIHIKIMDFGIARLMNEGTKLTIAGSIAGTPRYMSPEQVEGKEVDHRADIYSLGVVLYETLTGVQPFDGTSIGEILRKQVMQPLPSLGDLAPGIPLPPIDHVLAKACAKNRDERYQSMAAFAEALDQYQVTQQQLRAPTGVLSAAAIVESPRATDVAAVSIAGSATGLQKGNDLGTVSGNASLLSKSLDGRSSASAHTEAGAAPLVVQKSKLPIIAGAVLLIGVAAAAAVALRPAKVAVVPPIEVIRPPVPPPVVPIPVDPPQVKNPDVPMVPLHDALTAIQLENSRNAFGNGTTAWDNGDLGTARNFYVGVPTGAPDYEKAAAQIKVIDEITANTNRAQALRSSGHCGDAKPLFRAALKLNSKYRDAASGLSACEAGTIPGQME